MHTFPWRELRYALWLPVYLVLFVVLEHIPNRTYWVTDLPIDGTIPFCEWFILPYCLWFPLMFGVGLWLLLRHPAAFRRYMLFLGLTFLSTEVLWIFWPNAQNLRPAVLPRDNALTAIVSALYHIDTNTNVFPSLHVVGAVGVALAARDACPRQHLVWGGTTALAALICASTLFVKQHALLDVAGGLLWSLPAAVWVYRGALSRRRRT